MQGNSGWPRELVAVELATTAESVARYSDLTADFNPIHLDADFAARTPFGRPIAQGTMALNLIIEAIERTFSGMPEGAAIDTRFIKPMPVGVILTAGGTLKDETTGTYDVFIETDAGERALEGICTLARP